jgi:thymidylate synthase
MALHLSDGANLIYYGATALYHNLINEVLCVGEEVEARGLKFSECRFVHATLVNPRLRIITSPSRKFQKRFMIAEFIWMMNGRCMLDSIEPYNHNLRQFSDDGISMSGAYGPRLRRWGQPRYELDQIANTIKKLKEDLYTRQAVMIILDPAKDLAEKTKDVPCNDLLHFMFRDGALDLACYVRSNDLLLGFPYDIAHWTMLQEMIASELNVPLGRYHHFVGSLHIYNNDLPKFDKIMKDKIEEIEMPEMPENINVISTIEQLGAVEENFRNTGNLNLEKVDEYWKPLLEHLKK